MCFAYTEVMEQDGIVTFEYNHASFYLCLRLTSPTLRIHEVSPLQ